MLLLVVGSCTALHKGERMQLANLNCSHGLGPMWEMTHPWYELICSFNSSHQEINGLLVFPSRCLDPPIIPRSSDCRRLQQG